MSLDTPVSVRIEAFRRRAQEGTLTIEDMREAIALLRASRSSAATRSRKATPTAIDADQLLDDLTSL